MLGFLFIYCLPITFCVSASVSISISIDLSLSLSVYVQGRDDHDDAGAALLDACMSGSLKKVKKVFKEQGGDRHVDSTMLNEKGNTPLHVAALKVI